jgi:hypothetical protein
MLDLSYQFFLNRVYIYIHTSPRPTNRSADRANRPRTLPIDARAPARGGAHTLPVEPRRPRPSRWYSLMTLPIELTHAQPSRSTQRACDPRESAIFLFAQSFCYDIKHFATMYPTILVKRIHPFCYSGSHLFCSAIL